MSKTALYRHGLFIMQCAFGRALLCIAALFFAQVLSFAQVPVFAQPLATPPALDILQRADGARIVPDRFLRSWDPVTIFFDRDLGPAKGGPEDDPRRFVTVEPDVPGAWQWLGARALQFRPADPWKPLAAVRFTGEGLNARLVPLLPTPISSDPAADADPVTELDHVVLTFADPVDVATLTRLLRVEVRPAPGLDAASGLTLGPQDVSVRALSRASAGAQQSYLVQLRQAVSDSRVAIVRLKLSDDSGLDDPTWELAVRSAEPFAVSKIACGRGLDDQIVGSLLRCKPYATSSSGDDESSAVKPSSAKRTVSVTFTAKPDEPDVVKARDAIRISPAVDDLAVMRDGTKLRLTAKFLADTVYEIAIAPGALRDERKRALEGPTFVGRVAFGADKPALVWDANEGIVERFGPQIVPMRGNGYDTIDLRIHKIDPLAREFWPFPADGLQTDDAAAPPLPGNEPAKWTDDSDADADAMIARLKALGSPAVSDLVKLPIRRGGVAAKFGLDLKPWFTKIGGEGQPGTYLVGMRTVDGATRDWMRVQVTDLTLSTIEEASRVRFVVTSLATARVVAEADIWLEGVRDDKFVALATGTTDTQGAFVWDAANRKAADIKRIVVRKGLDVLVLEPDSGPAEYAKENWTKPEASWLAWTTDEDVDRTAKARTLCHVFTERPIYRPEEPVHIKGYVRSYLGGALTYAKGGGTVVVTGPANQEWRVPVKLDATGNFYHRFDAPTPATGDYQVRYEADRPKAKEKAKPDKADVQEGAQDDAADDGDRPALDTAQADGDAEADSGSCGAFPFKKEAYRLPTFEVLLHAPERTPLDGAFNVDLVARYFAGGLVANRPIKWRASQFPYTWTPPGREGWLFSSDARFSQDGAFKATPVLEREGTTDAGGSARIAFDPAIEPTAQPRRYQIEATVAGDDDIQVRNVTSVIALPAFVLGVKAPRYLPKAGAFEPEILAVDATGKPLEGLEMTVRFLRRNWSSVLQASDFAQGSAKYVTEVIDETILERKVTSTKDAQKLSFETREAGVYLVQIEASDRIGRRQQISVDTFVGGDTPVTWARAPSQTAEVTTDKDAYAPGETATLVIQSPFQTARALAIVEEPQGRFRYDWIDIANGFGRYPVTIAKEETPRLAVHFLIMRGRLPGAIDPSAPFDQGKPVTIAATKWVTVTPVKNIVVASLEAPAKARPGQEVEVTLRLADDLGRPMAGEATFWMIDQAVLSLAKERPLDPLKNFIVDRPTKMAARDTRNMAFGIIPLEEVPGGDAGLEEWGTDSNVSVRKNFTPVPIYLPKVIVGADGVAKIKVKLPDSLTMFKLRAKAIAGPDRFGFATGEMLIRQELVAQPALPRFVRPGDTFDAGLIGRVVEGPSGTGRLTLAANGLTLAGAAEQRFAWQQNTPARLDFPVAVPEGAATTNVRLRFGLSRDSDRASDTVEIALPVRPDRAIVKTHQIADIAPNGSFPLGAAAGAARPGTFSREVTLATDPALVRLIAGLDALLEYPYGCTEQRIATASAGLALKPFGPVLAATGFDKRLSADVRNTLQAIAGAIDPHGLVAFWPKARGNVSLTAWAYAFATAAKKAGEPVDAALSDRLATVLKLSLRSDYGRLIVGSELRERVEALTALADGGQLDAAYVAELARRASAMPNQSVAQMARAVAALPGDDRRVVMSLLDTMWTRVQILSRNGRPTYAGLAAESADPVILPSEVRSLAEMTRAVATATPDDARLAILRDGLMRIGGGDGWGSTNATSAAVRALSEAWKRPATMSPVSLTVGAATKAVALTGDMPVVRTSVSEAGDGRVDNRGGTPIIALIDVSYRPVESGAKAQAVTNGFVVTRESFRVPAKDAPERLTPDGEGVIRLTIGDVIEDVVEIVNPEDRTHVAISAPLAAGLEPLNPRLANAPAEAAPSGEPTLDPTWTAFEDDKVFYAYDVLPKGNYRFLFRTRAQVVGAFTQPPAETELMYKAGVAGASAGRRIVIGR